MGIQDGTFWGARHSDRLGSGRGAVRFTLGAQFSECRCLFFWRRDLCDGTQASFAKEVDLVIRQVQQHIEDLGCEFQQVERLGNSCSGHAQMFRQVCLGGTSALIEDIFENERLFHRIDDRHCRFSWWRACFGACGFKTRYEELASMHAGKVRKEGQIEEVRESFGRGEPCAFLRWQRSSRSSCIYAPVGRKPGRGASASGFPRGRPCRIGPAFSNVRPPAVTTAVSR